MTPEQVGLVQASFAGLGDRVDDLARAFYERLFELDPAAEAMFSLDQDVLRAKFLEELGAIVTSISDLDDFVERATHLGARHRGYGVGAAHYRAGAAALVGAIGDVLGDDCTPATLDAWRLAYNLVAETMMRGALGVATPPVVRRGT